MNEEIQPEVVDGGLLARAEQAEAQVAELRTKVEALEAAAASSPASPTLFDKLEEQKTGILKLIFTGISVLMGYLGVLVLVNWLIPGSSDTDGIGSGFFQTSKDILLVLTGILGSAMANVFDSRSKPKDGE